MGGDQHTTALHHGEVGVVDQTRGVVVHPADGETERRRSRRLGVGPGHQSQTVAARLVATVNVLQPDGEGRLPVVARLRQVEDALLITDVDLGNSHWVLRTASRSHIKLDSAL